MPAKATTHRFKVGFTLIELLVTISIVGTLFAVGYGNYRDYVQKQTLLGATRQMEGSIKQAQSYALSARKPAGCVALDGYKFILSGSTYKIAAYCQGNIDITDSEISLPDKISASPSSAEVMFKTIGDGTDLDGLLVITLTQEHTGYQTIVSVSTSGEIKYGFQEE